MWYVYIIKSDSLNKLYTGVTIDSVRRLCEHNGELRGGAKATRPGRPWRIVYIETTESRSLALKREAKIKKMSRAEKDALLCRDNINGSMTGFHPVRVGSNPSLC